MKTNKNPNRHFSATVTHEAVERLATISAIYSSNPSAIASSLLQAAANVGPDKFPEFMREMKRIELTLIGSTPPVSPVTIPAETLERATLHLDHAAASTKAGRKKH